MKTFVPILLFLAIISCQDSSSANKSNPFDKSVGIAISHETAERWISNYNASNLLSRSQTNHFKISKVQLNNLLSSCSDNIQGITFHFGTDQNIDQHILVSGMDKTYNLLQGRIIDSNNDTEIDKSIAEKWIASFQKDNNDIWFYFFGSDIIEEINNINDFAYMEIFKAINDDGKQQLVLYVFTGLENARAHSHYLTYDGGSPCPPCPR